MKSGGIPTHRTGKYCAYGYLANTLLKRSWQFAIISIPVFHFSWQMIT